MARVFVSHASEDRALAGEVRRWLVDSGHEVFLDQDLRDGIAPGEEWEQRLHERLRWTNAMLCVVTSAYLNSIWCAAEIGIARSRGSQLLPLHVEPGVVHPLLTSVQHIDYTADPPTARAAVIKALHRVDAAWPDDRSPFPGLRPFDTDQGRIFFGRTEEVKHLTELLRSPAERAEGAALLVVGPSGCGKSSLVRAGLLPMMTDQPGWRTLPPILPSTNPVAALARELATAARQSGLDWTVEHVHHQLSQRGLTGLVDELLLADPAGPQQCLLIVVDQFEELLTQTISTERARFAELLSSALSGPVRVVATLRPEFLDQLLLDPELATLPTRTYTLRPLRREALRTVIEKPARLAGIDVDDGLVDRLVDDTATGEALPLLAFTLAQLADGITRGGQLSGARYNQLGGVRGALTHLADAALTDAVTVGGRSPNQVIAGLLRLVTVDEQGRPTRWRVLRDELPDRVTIELRAFVTRRLLITDTDNGTVVVGVAHEAFLSAWPPLAEAIAASVSALRARRAVEHAAADWNESERPLSRLWGGGQLAAAVADTGARISAGNASPPGRQERSRWLPQRHRVLVTDRVDVSPNARDFLHASLRHDRHRRRRATTVLSMLLILALVGAGVSIFLQNLAEERQRIATARQLITQADSLRDADPRTAVRLGVAAERLHSGSETQIGLFNLLSATRYAGTLTAHTDWVSSAAFSSDGRTLATGDRSGTVTLWDLTNPLQPHQLGPRLTAHTDAVNSVAFSSDGDTLATAIGDTLAGSSVGEGTVILWDLSDPARPHQLGPSLGHAEAVHSVAFSLDGHTVATASDRNVYLWDLTNPAQPRQLESPPDQYGRVEAVAFSPDGHAVAAVSTTGAVLLWDLTNSAPPRQLDPPLNNFAGSKLSVAFSPDGHALAAAGARSVRLWDLTNSAQPQQPDPLPDDVGEVQSVAFSPDVRTLAAATANSVLLWDLTGTAQVQLHQLDPPLDHTGVVASAAFSPDTHTLVTTGADGEVFLWDLTSAAQPHQFDPPPDHSRGIRPVAVSPDGHTLATANVLIGSGEVFLWDLTDPARPQRLSPRLNADSGSTLYSAEFSSDGRILATAHGGFGDGEVFLWDLTNPAEPHQLGATPRAPNGSILSVAFSADGHILATASNNGTVQLWDLTNPAQPDQLDPPLADTASSVAFAPNRDTLAVASDNGTVQLWDLTNPAQPDQLDPPLNHTNAVFSVAFAPDGHTMAVTSANSVILWDLTDPAQPRQLNQTLEHSDTVLSVAFAPDGRTLATSDSAALLLWDLTDPAQPRQLGPPLDSSGKMLSVTFTSDGHTLATSNDGRTASLWDLLNLDYLRDHVTERACAIAGGGLSPEEWHRYIPDLAYQDTCPT